MPGTDERQSTILKALADENRIRLLRLLSREVLNVQELCEILDLPQSRVSRHLSILRANEMVHDQREGSRVYYSLAKLDGDFELISSYLNGISQQEHPDLERMEAVIRRRTRQSRDFAEEQASHWDELGAELHSSTAALLCLAELMHGDRVCADLGTGTGLLLPILSCSSSKVYAVDHSSEMLGYAEERCRNQGVANVEFLRCDLNEVDKHLPELCDCIMLHFVLHQLSRPRSIIETMARCLNTNGNLVIVDRTKHDDEVAREKFGSLWLGFEASFVEEALRNAGLERVRYHQLPSDADGARGIFVATATKCDSS